MGRRGWWVLGAVVWFTLGVTPAHAATCTVVDQRNLVSVGNIVVSEFQVPGQTFVAELGGQLVGIEVAPLIDTSSPNATVFLDLLDDTGHPLGTASEDATGFPPGAGTVPEPLQEAAIGPGYFDLSSLSVFVAPGTKLFFRVRNDEVGVCDQNTLTCVGGGRAGSYCWDVSQCYTQMRVGESGDEYPLGEEHFILRYPGVPDEAIEGADEGFDLAFKTFVAVPCASVTPTPTTTPTTTPTPSATVTGTNGPTDSPTSTASAAPEPTPGATVAAPCAAMPEAGCRRANANRTSRLALKYRAPDRGDLLTWKWTKGTTTSKTDLGDPTETTNYALCVYDETADLPSLVLASEIPAGGTCAGRSCWKPTGHGFRYANEDATPNGVTVLALKEGLEGASAIRAKGRGAKLSMPALPLSQDPRVVVQLKNDLGVCWEAIYSAPALRNEQTEFRDKSD